MASEPPVAGETSKPAEDKEKKAEIETQIETPLRLRTSLQGVQVSAVPAASSTAQRPPATTSTTDSPQKTPSRKRPQLRHHPQPTARRSEPVAAHSTPPATASAPPPSGPLDPATAVASGTTL
ncbi:non-specific lipid transfer protein GPI-anchored 23-like [Cryptomeria japonica]|uniref:non-specific lipid transfer protein GPI-anchored 23-like n=1 Tax=Cryptomeria japonica TaxID=3369 RepID=UPI0025AC6089|nr:non-specific lipid transfer protein GPI-anchored 23-like [Cryptomeria japonica]